MTQRKQDIEEALARFINEVVDARDEATAIETAVENALGDKEYIDQRALDDAVEDAVEATITANKLVSEKDLETAVTDAVEYETSDFVQEADLEDKVKDVVGKKLGEYDKTLQDAMEARIEEIVKEKMLTVVDGLLDALHDLRTDLED